MILTQGLFDYLTDPVDLPGAAAVRFARQQEVYGLKMQTRNEARAWIRSKVGQRVYASRLPAGVDGTAAILMQTLSSEQENSLLGAEDTIQTTLQLDALARSGDAARRAETIAHLLLVACGGFYGDKWGQCYIGESIVQRGAQQIDPPRAASDTWTHRFSVDLSVTHQGPAAVMPTRQLQALVTFPLPAGASSELRLSAADSVVPENRSITTIQWTVRTGGAGGPIAVQMIGPPQNDPNFTGITGTVLEPALDRSTFGLSGTLVHVTLTVTLDTSDADTSAVERQE